MFVKAKEDLKILMEDGRFSNFIKGNKYRYIIRKQSVILMDEDKMGFECSMEEFKQLFE